MKSKLFEKEEDQSKKFFVEIYLILRNVSFI